MTRSTGVLVERAADGDHRAFRELLSRYDRRLRGLAYSLLAGDAQSMDDVLQEAYLKAYRSLGRFRQDSDPGTWLYRIVYNACIDELRQARRRPEPVEKVEVDRHAPTQTTPGEDPGTRAAVEDTVVRMLRALPVDQRVTLVLVDGQGLTTADTARVLGIAHGTVRSRLSRARASARQMLDEGGS